MAVSELDTTAHTCEQDSIRESGTFRRYCAMLALVVTVGYLAGFLVVQMPGYERWGGSYYTSTLAYAFETAGQNADIVIFGDSSAMYAVNPLQMSQQLGLKVINLPNTIGGLPADGDVVLRHYLGANRAPRLIVFFFCPWNLDYERATGTRFFEGEEMLVRYGTWREIAGFGLRHPSELFDFPFRVYRSWAPAITLGALSGHQGTPDVAALRGHRVNTISLPPLSTDCLLPGEIIREHHATTVRELMVRYHSSRTSTMLYLAPVPACANVDMLLGSVKESLQVAPPPVFPANDFTSDNYYAHLTANAVSQATKQLTDSIEARLAGGVE